MNNYKLTKEQYEKLYSDDIIKKEYDEIISQIDDRFDYIMQTICTKLDWYDYDNGWKETDGYFQPNKYHRNGESFITFDGDYSMPAPYNSCPDIPIRWLWEDFEQEFKKEVEDARKKQEEKKSLDKISREQNKILRAKCIESIKSKLTKEELKFVKFK